MLRLFVGMVIGAMMAILLADGPAAADRIIHNVQHRFSDSSHSIDQGFLIILGIVCLVAVRWFKRGSGQLK